MSRLKPGLVLIATTAFAAATLLTACASETKPTAIDVPPTTIPENAAPEVVGCDPVQAQWAIGKTGDDSLLAKAQADAGAKIARFLKPHQAITEEYNASRLNLSLDDKGVVDKVGCG